MSEIFKKASKLGLTVPTVKGELSVDQLWGLKLVEIEKSIRNVKGQLKKVETEDSELDFLTSTTDKDDTNQLRFDILKEIYIDKKEENQKKLDAAKKKEDREKILALIARKKDSELEGKSIEELEALL